MREHPRNAQAAVQAYQENQIQGHTALAEGAFAAFSQRRANPTRKAKVPRTQAMSCVIQDDSNSEGESALAL